VLKAQTGDTSKIRAVAEFVREKGDGQNYKAALAGIESLEKLLAAAGNLPAPTASPPTVTADSGAAAFNARLAALMPQVKEAIAAATDTSLDVKLKISEAGVFARKKDFEQANGLLDEAEELVKDVLNPPEAGEPGELRSGEAEDSIGGVETRGGSAPDLESALDIWRSTRSVIIDRLKTIAKQIADTKDPEADKAILEVSAVYKQLTGDPRTAQQVKELQRWISQDDVVLDVSELAEDISTPLLQALNGVQMALDAVA
ncbi:MAG: hypothetical protein H7238_06630, partial [Polaromonas sp.]|nr:hypothetical protein [Polaromonas sp.]